MAFFKKYYINTTQEIDIISISADVNYAIRDSQTKDGLLTVVIPGAGGSVIVSDGVKETIDELKTTFELFAGEGGEGVDKFKKKVAVAPRVRSAVFGRSVSIPVVNGKLTLDPYEEVFLVDFDKNAKRREFAIYIAGEGAGQPQQGQRPPPAQRKK